MIIVRAAAIAASLLIAAVSPAVAVDSTPACAAARAYSSALHGVSVLIRQDGVVVCEAYANGGGADAAWPIHSGTKSFNGVIAAAAAQDGLLTLDEPVSKTLAEWRGDPAKAAVTIRQLLQLTSGLGGRAFPAPDFEAAVIQPFAAPTGTFQYAAAPFQVFGAVMRRKLEAAGRDPDPTNYLKTRILDPIGMSWAGWRRTPGGDAMLDQGANLTAREWAKYGEFVRGGGRVDGKPIVDPATFATLFQGSAANPAYGVTWWLPMANDAPDVVTARLDLRGHEADLPADMVIAAGAGDQRLYVVPSCRLTVVRQAKLDAQRIRAARAGGGGMRDGWSDFAFIKPILDAYCR
jgi:CubicO group peptidase (beta-lactamase class C family)